MHRVHKKSTVKLALHMSIKPVKVMDMHGTRKGNMA